MEEKRKSFVFYRDWYDTIMELDKETSVEVLRLIMSYALGEEYHSDSVVANTLLLAIKPQIERDIQKWKDVKAVRKETGRLGGLSKSKQLVAIGSNCKQKVANATINIYNDTNVSKSDNIDRDKEEEVLDKPKTPKKRFVKPTVGDIQNYVNEKNYHIDAEEFFNFYESKGWVVGKSPMKDWKAACRTWQKTWEKSHGQKTFFKDEEDSSEDMVINGQVYR